jgi:hypothetical protein
MGVTSGVRHELRRVVAVVAPSWTYLACFFHGFFQIPLFTE